MEQTLEANIEQLLKAILALETPAEARMFLSDLLTEKELQEFAKRWRAAQMLADSVPYTQIVQETGLSSTTIARISRWLSEGTGGYQLMLERVRSREAASNSSTNSDSPQPALANGNEKDVPKRHQS